MSDEVKPEEKIEEQPVAASAETRAAKPADETIAVAEILASAERRGGPYAGAVKLTGYVASVSESRIELWSSLAGSTRYRFLRSDVLSSTAGEAGLTTVILTGSAQVERIVLGRATLEASMLDGALLDRLAAGMPNMSLPAQIVSMAGCPPLTSTLTCPPPPDDLRAHEVRAFLALCTKTGCDPTSVTCPPPPEGLRAHEVRAFLALCTKTGSCDPTTVTCPSAESALAFREIRAFLALCTKTGSCDPTTVTCPAPESALSGFEVRAFLLSCSKTGGCDPLSLRCGDGSISPEDVRNHLAGLKKQPE